MNSPRSCGKKDHPFCKWRNKECAAYCVTTPIRFKPELIQLDNAKSMIRRFPPKYSAGFARLSVNSCRREPRPPAKISTSVFLTKSYLLGSWERPFFIINSVIFLIIHIFQHTKRHTTHFNLLLLNR